MATRRRKLDAWQLEDAARLRAIWDEKKPMTQADFGDKYGIGNQAAVWQYLTGRIQLNLDAAAKFAEGLGVDIRAFSPTLAAKRDELAKGSRLAGTHTLTAREEIVLELLRGMTPEQVEEELLPAMRAAFDANRATTRILGAKLRTTGNHRVGSSYGIPGQEQETVKKGGR